MSNKLMTVCCIYNDNQILLGMKKRGFGAGRWNGFGGKVHEGETIEQAAMRELKEEAGIKAKKITKRGVILFEFENNSESPEVHFFSVDDYEGSPVETEEMKPQWFSHGEIPYKSMWPDDPYWMPLLLAGKNFKGKFLFDSNGDNILKYELKED
jgi:8-oxo-dGTP diphosphatase/2-hydroxy-dATP diphosphatase